MLPCAYKYILGIDCPVCGGQRSFLLLLKGDIAGSFQMYPPLLPVLFLAALSIVYLVNRKAVPVSRLKFFSIVVLTIVLINYAARLIAGV